MFDNIKKYCDLLVIDFETILPERKIILNQLADYLHSKQQLNMTANLVYICTHNSRRSHFGQVWATVAAFYYQLKNINTFSGGTEVTAFNSNAINALRRVGFKIESSGNTTNPEYKVFFEEDKNPVICFSKLHNHPTNPAQNFAAVITCDDAEQNCPFIPGAELRIATTYIDPKAYDNTPSQENAYDDRCRQIALETFYIFSAISKNK